MVSLRVKNLTIDYPIRTKGLGGIKLKKTNNDKRITFNDDDRPVVRAVDDLSFELQSGDKLAVIGGNGSGKTTLLLALAGILPPAKGSVVHEGKLDALFNIRAGFAADATGRRNIYLRGLVNGWSDEQIEKVTDEVIEFSELGGFIDMPFHTYSQGMAARLAFGVATAFHSEILLMDEWIGAGDRNFYERAKTRMDNYVKKAGIIVLASHNDALLKRMCNKALVLERGSMVDFGAIGDVMAKLPSKGGKRRSRAAEKWAEKKLLAQDVAVDPLLLDGPKIAKARSNGKTLAERAAKVPAKPVTKAPVKPKPLPRARAKKPTE